MWRPNINNWKVTLYVKYVKNLTKKILKIIYQRLSDFLSSAYY